MVKKVAIIGAGSSGLLLAHYLLRRGDKYQIGIYERRSDPRIVSFSIQNLPYLPKRKGNECFEKN
jgi:kynurenine 3-monooxygenase